MDKLFVIVRVDGVRGIGRAADVDGGPLNIEGPIESHNLCEGVDTVLGAEAGIRVVLCCLNRLVLRCQQVLGNLIDDEVERIGIVSRVVGDQARVGSETGIGLVIGDVSGRGRGLFDLCL